MFHFVTLDYFRHKDESSASESDSDAEQRGDFVEGGIYAPAATQSISAAAAGLTLSIAAAAGIKRLILNQNDDQASNTNGNNNGNNKNGNKNES
jgi:hypothetical protein